MATNRTSASASDEPYTVADDEAPRTRAEAVAVRERSCRVGHMAPRAAAGRRAGQSEQGVRAPGGGQQGTARVASKAASEPVPGSVSAKHRVSPKSLGSVSTGDGPLFRTKKTIKAG
ncbi:hypothetical protein SSP24_64600 [Streptomyces spinoverrucosus]|uniref:Uncharacterized protein n=1 Tax=Streptomyces spinoverrucosus TaxID=284043 RepID=A0A4Y3VS00_9ACTN|nr:hypothetical protein SSP24_64600 [Streptomyces spinoverrucosus]GHB88777.1 hypothetical protein GCM10010397_70890 [Streptomyces spinoverrucosus]